MKARLHRQGLGGDDCVLGTRGVSQAMFNEVDPKRAAVLGRVGAVGKGLCR